MATQTTKITEEEYLRLERAAEYKSEYIGGEIFPMPGGSFRHSRLTINWSTQLRNQLRGTPYAVYSSDMRVRTPSTGSYVYPDVSVVSGAPVPYGGSDDILTNPKLVVEVLSPSTARYDRRDKFELYREIPSVSDYILVHQGTVHVEHFARQLDGSWVLREYKGDDAVLALASVHCAIRLGDVYSDLP